MFPSSSDSFHSPRYPLPSAMTLPANDAFTLGLAHDGTTRTTRTRSRSITRSPSPLSNMTTSRVERGLTRRANKRAGSSSNMVSSVESSKSLEEIQERREDSPQPAVLASATKPAPAAIDWEIPRKLLHSSIGAFCSVFYFFVVAISNSNQVFSHCISIMQTAPRARS